MRHRSESSKVIRLTSFTDISECLKPQLDRRYTYTEEPLVSILRTDLSDSSFNWPMSPDFREFLLIYIVFFSLLNNLFYFFLPRRFLYKNFLCVSFCSTMLLYTPLITILKNSCLLVLVWGYLRYKIRLLFLLNR